jgi:2-oxoglutarate dehydrogenase complex dehydrogenase (E1) component-like enzyme
VHEFLIGKHDFTKTFSEPRHSARAVALEPRSQSVLPSGDQVREQTLKEARVIELINAYRVRGT